MKKIALTLGLAAVAFGFSACNETWDDNPTIKAPNKEYTDFLNEPELRETWITIDKNGADNDAALHMTCSQPDFGYAAIANYVVEVCLTPTPRSPSSTVPSPKQATTTRPSTPSPTAPRSTPWPTKSPNVSASSKDGPPKRKCSPRNT